MSSVHHFARAARRSTNVAVDVTVAPAPQFQNDSLSARRLLSRIHAQLRDAWQLACLWKRRHRDRAALRSLSPRDIRDFCPRQAEAEEEMNKPFWRA